MTNLLKQLTERSSLIHEIYSSYVIRNQKRAVNGVARRLSDAGFSVIDAETLYERLRPESHRVCHVMGSGWSVLHGYQKIKSADFVIGINFSGLANVKNDLYFVEFGGHEIEAISRRQIELVDAVVRPQGSLILFKNLWESRNDYRFIRENWGERVSYIRDFSLPCRSPAALPKVLQRLLEFDATYLHQYRSTAITAIVTAVRAGFTSIVLHGIDFGGAYFFDLPEFDGYTEYRPPENRSQKLYKPATTESVHVTSKDALGVKSILPILGRMIATDGVHLYSGSAESPLAAMFPVYAS